ncbi:facilitated trehalose transporter Tret1-like isoform X1 [Contarinia nasturtii]|uniref:facilitated trehalose transporter Tret1-like isoform X1 n=1 Tax=Contarinia nasturtii TaxID=265458 RepID=UPI0012D3F3D7|nr:facilitated trehalose transporter Tret1-like isoform X1 [Contarinia nasturtii]
MSIDETTTMQKQSVTNQFLVTFVVGLFMLTGGITMGWTSSSILVLMSDETPLASGKITIEEASWIASLPYAGGIIGNIVFGFVINKFGRKIPIFLLAFPSFLSWLMILFASNSLHLCVARFINGIVSGCSSIATPLFLAEISSDRIRGAILATLVSCSIIGTLLSFVFGHFFHYYITPKITLVIIALFAFFILFFPESPVFLVKRNRISEAKKSIRFYQSLRRDRIEDNDVLQQELKKLETIFASEAEVYSNNGVRAFRWTDLNTKIARKALLIGIVLCTLQQCGGGVAYASYAAKIFQETGSNMSPNVSAIVTGAIEFAGILVAVYLIDRAGRKFLYKISTFGMASGLIIFGIYVHLKSLNYNVETFNWIPLTCFSFILFIMPWAVSSLPFGVVPEIMPEQLKDFGWSFCMTLLWIWAFIMVKFFPFLNETLGMHGTLYAFATVCLSGALFVITYLPETKGKSYEEIMELLNQ